MSSVRKPRFDVPDLGVGVGLRTKHFGHVLEHAPDVGWFEVITENFLDVGGRPAFVLDEVARRHPIVLHGVSLSIGGTDPLDRAYLAKVKALAERTRARIVSDHVCWTGVAGRNVHDLLPLPYTEACLKHVVKRVRAVQDALERPLVLENASTYVEFRSSTMREHEFLARLADEADCGLLLDVNNVYVSARNHGFDPLAYVEGLPHERIAYFHVAGHTDKGTHLLDTHSGRARREVWQLYRRAVELTGGRSTLYEWDEDIPEFDVVWGEARKAEGHAREALAKPGRGAASMRSKAATRENVVAQSVRDTEARPARSKDGLTAASRRARGTPTTPASSKAASRPSIEERRATAKTKGRARATQG